MFDYSGDRTRTTALLLPATYTLAAAHTYLSKYVSCSSSDARTTGLTAYTDHAVIPLKEGLEPFVLHRFFDVERLSSVSTWVYKPKRADERGRRTHKRFDLDANSLFSLNLRGESPIPHSSNLKGDQRRRLPSETVVWTRYSYAISMYSRMYPCSCFS